MAWELRVWALAQMLVLVLAPVAWAAAVLLLVPAPVAWAAAVLLLVLARQLWELLAVLATQAAAAVAPSCSKAQLA